MHTGLRDRTGSLRGRLRGIVNNPGSLLVPKHARVRGPTINLKGGRDAPIPVWQEEEFRS